jgi:hypothetical protein
MELAGIRGQSGEADPAANNGAGEANGRLNIVWLKIFLSVRRLSLECRLTGEEWASAQRRSSLARGLGIESFAQQECRSFRGGRVNV